MFKRNYLFLEDRHCQRVCHYSIYLTCSLPPASVRFKSNSATSTSTQACTTSHIPNRDVLSLLQSFQFPDLLKSPLFLIPRVNNVKTERKEQRAYLLVIIRDSLKISTQVCTHTLTDRHRQSSYGSTSI